jgi:HTH-type transcriptional regulator/antitoxin HigA
METKIIRTEEQYHSYLNEVERLMARGDALSKDEVNRLEVLSVLIEAFENSKFPVEPPDPIDAILFRMEEKGLKQADLIPYFGTSSRVSEVLNRKRPLTVQMIRALSIGLGISAETLIGLGETTAAEKAEVDWSKFPVKEMVSRGWLEHVAGPQSDLPEVLVKNYIASAGLQMSGASFRRTLSGPAKSPSTVYALYAWLARVIQRTRAKKKKLGKFDKAALSNSFVRELAQLSWSDKGPLLALEYLQKHGISVVIEPQLRGTQLDGAALKDIDGTPVIGLTLRFDRLDNFWFTLVHEVIHIWKHVDSDAEAFVDDMKSSSDDRREAEANRIASEAFIPRLTWKRSDAYLSPSRESIERLARDLRIHPAIVVGRIHKETGNFALFNSMLSHQHVKKLLSSFSD